MLHAPAVQERNINIAVADVSKERQGARVPNRGACDLSYDRDAIVRRLPELLPEAEFDYIIGKRSFVEVSADYRR